MLIKFLKISAGALAAVLAPHEGTQRNVGFNAEILRYMKADIALRLIRRPT